MKLLTVTMFLIGLIMWAMVFVTSEPIITNTAVIASMGPGGVPPVVGGGFPFWFYLLRF